LHLYKCNRTENLLGKFYYLTIDKSFKILSWVELDNQYIIVLVGYRYILQWKARINKQEEVKHSTEGPYNRTKLLWYM
jgi:hypothetical protein